GYAESLGDLASHFVLYFEDVFHLAVKAFRPERKVGASVNQLGADAQADAGAPQRAGEHISGTKLLANLRRGDRLVAKGQHRGAGKSIQSTNLGELGDDVFGDAIAEILIFLGAAQIFEIEDSDGLF